jgi:hypothetical protein
MDHASSFRVGGPTGTAGDISVPFSAIDERAPFRRAVCLQLRSRSQSRSLYGSVTGFCAGTLFVHVRSAMDNGPPGLRIQNDVLPDC